jgi:hypothetical protein
MTVDTCKPLQDHRPNAFTLSAFGERCIAFQTVESSHELHTTAEKQRLIGTPMKRAPLFYMIGLSALAITSIAMPLTAVAQEPETAVHSPLFEPSITQAQKTDIQQQINEQLQRKNGGKQISSTQIAYNGGNAVITFAVPTAPNTTCDFGYVCFWENINYLGKKLSLRSTPERRTENLAQYDMSNKISSWKHNNNFFYVAIAGADQPNQRGKMVMTNEDQSSLGSTCCPFSVGESDQKAPKPEFVFQQSVRYNDAMQSVGFYPYPW